MIMFTWMATIAGYLGLTNYDHVWLKIEFFSWKNSRIMVLADDPDPRSGVCIRVHSFMGLDDLCHARNCQKFRKLNLNSVNPVERIDVKEQQLF